MKIKITSGEYPGRFIGPIMRGLVTNPSLLATPGVQLLVAPYMLYAQEQMAMKYFNDSKAKEVQAILKNIGLDSELVP